MPSHSGAFSPSPSPSSRPPSTPRARGIPFVAVLAIGLGIVTAAIPVGAAQGVRVEVEFFENGAKEPTNRARVFISERRLRIEQSPTGASEDAPVFLYRGDRNLLYSIVEGERTYLKIQPRMLMSMGGARAARRDLATGIDPIPADQQRFFGHLLGVSQIDSRRREEALVVRRTGNVRNYSGVACREVELGYPDRLLAKGCVASWQDVGITPEDVEIFRSLASLVSSASGRGGALPIEMVPGQPLDLVVQLGGFPLFFERAGRSAETSAIRVASVERLELEDAQFDVPEGYAARSGVTGVFGFASLLSSRRAASGPKSAFSSGTTGPAAIGSSMPASLAPDAGEHVDGPPRRASTRRRREAVEPSVRVVDHDASRTPDYLRYRPIRLFEDSD